MISSNNHSYTCNPLFNRKMPTGDSRKDYILATTANYFGLGVTDAAITALQDSTPLNNFLDDGNIDLCAGRIETRGSTKRLGFSNKVNSTKPK